MQMRNFKFKGANEKYIFYLLNWNKIQVYDWKLNLKHEFIVQEKFSNESFHFKDSIIKVELRNEKLYIASFDYINIYDAENGALLKRINYNNKRCTFLLDNGANIIIIDNARKLFKYFDSNEQPISKICFGKQSVSFLRLLGRRTQSSLLF